MSWTIADRHGCIRGGRAKATRLLPPPRRLMADNFWCSRRRLDDPISFRQICSSAAPPFNDLTRSPPAFATAWRATTTGTNAGITGRAAWLSRDL